MRRLIGAGAAALLVALTLTVARAGIAATPGGCPEIYAHRTDPLERPENTVVGIQAVPATGAEGVEMDIQWSSSSFPVLMHDTTVDRTTNGTGAASTLSLGQLTALLDQDYAPWKTNPAYAGVHVPYGYEFMSAVSSENLDVLLHISATPAQLGTNKLRIYVNDYFAWTGRSLVMANADQVIAMRAWEPGLRYAVIEYPPTGRLFTPEYLASIGAGTYVLPYTQINPAMVAWFHAGGIKVYAWTSDLPAYDVAANWKAVADAGADALITNQPAAARTALGCDATPTPTVSPSQSTIPPVDPTTSPATSVPPIDPSGN
jgi:glycerophosphoryl diester phosphodiesterase